MYQEAILDHYRNPRHFGTLDPHTFAHRGENPLCGDTMEITVRLSDAEHVGEARFTGQGCAISQAAADILLDQVAGRSLDEVRAMTDQEMLTLLGVEVATMRAKCAVLGVTTLRDAIAVHLGEREAEAITRLDD